MNLINHQNQESSELIQQICGILDVNTFELRAPNSLGAGSMENFLRGLYQNAALMAHKCIGNTHLTVDNQFRLTIYAGTSIRENETIYFNYTSPLLSCAERRAYLMEGKYFLCRCSVCSDPSEAGSYLSGILCPKCKKGYILMQDPTSDSNQSYSKNAKWECQLCNKILRGCLIGVTLDIARSMVEEVDKNDVMKMEMLLKKLLRSLHTNHSLMLILKQKLLAGYRREVDVKYMEKKSLMRMLDLFREVLVVIDIMEPGISRLRGILLYEMHFPMIMLANREYTLREISSHDLITKLEEGRQLVKQAMTILFFEPPDSAEGLLAKEALEAFKTLGRNIVDVKLLFS